MTIIYPTAAGALSTRIWRKDSDGSLYGTTPQPGDIIRANGLAITIDIDLIVAELQTLVGTTAAAGGSFTATGTRLIQAIARAGTTSCLTLNPGSTLTGDCYGGSTGAAVGCIAQAGLTVINGTAYAGTGTSCHGCNLQGGFSRLNGDAYGSAANASGAVLQNGSTQVGNAYGGSGAANSIGSNIQSGSILYGNAFGGSAGPGANVAGGIQIGNSTGGSGPSAYGSSVNAGGIQQGTQTGGTNASAFGSLVQNGSLVITTGITDSTARGLGLNDAGSVIMLNGVTSGQIYIMASPGRYYLDNTRFPFISSSSGLSGFSMSRLINMGG